MEDTVVCAARFSRSGETRGSMRAQVVGVGVLLMGVGALRPVHAADLTVSFSGTAEVMVELVGANAAYNNSLAVQASGAGITAPGVRIRPAPENPLLNSSGCNLAPTGPLEADAGGFMAGATFPNVVVLSDRKFPPPSLIPTQRGCRVILDRQTGASSYSTTFSGTVTFRFYMCSQIDEDANCDY